MEKRTIILILLVVFAVLAGFYFINDIFYQVPLKGVQLSPDFNLVIPSDCSDASIKAFWDDIFDEVSDDVIITSDPIFAGVSWDICPYFFAYKNNSDQVHILIGNISSDTRFSFIAIKANVTQDYLDNLNSQGISFYHEAFSFPYIVNETYLILNTDVNTPEGADTLYKATFKIPDSGNWEYDSFQVQFGLYLYSFQGNVKSFDGVINFSGRASVSSNYSFLSLSGFKLNEDDSDCNEITFIPVNTSCVGNALTTWYDYIGSCSNVLIRPISFTSSCDSSTSTSQINGSIVGDITAFLQTNPDIYVYLDSSLLNLSELSFNETKSVEFRYFNQIFLTFDYDFPGSGDFDVDNIEIERQSSFDDFGYLIVNGINAQKTFMVDIINGSSQVCIKDTQVGSISEISSNCTSSLETLISCPGSANGFSCIISGGKFIVFGLYNSGVKEFVSTVSSNAGSNDSNNANLPAPCTPNWSCSSWSPESCPDNEEQTRTCTDINSCEVDSNKPLESQSCGYRGNLNSIIFFGVIIFIVVFISIMIIFILKEYNKQKLPKREEKIQRLVKPGDNLRISEV